MARLISFRLRLRRAITPQPYLLLDRHPTPATRLTNAPERGGCSMESGASTAEDVYRYSSTISRTLIIAGPFYRTLLVPTPVLSTCIIYEHILLVNFLYVHDACLHSDILRGLIRNEKIVAAATPRELPRLMYNLGSLRQGDFDV
ncbi:hypothetical protein C8R44DRAFT_727202 [Mycena epipterygia]|nr:hypothetical protein C8R44DRAFT_727202 [Mycena epipterygia]